MSILIDGQNKVDGGIASAFQKNERKDDLFNQIVNKHLDPKRTEAEASGKSASTTPDAGEKAGKKANAQPSTDDKVHKADAQASQGAAAIDPLKEAAPIEETPKGPSVTINGKGADAATGDVDLSDSQFTQGPETGLDAKGDAENLLAAGAQIKQEQGSIGQIPPGRGEAQTQKTTTAESLRQMVTGAAQAKESLSGAPQAENANVGAKITAQVTVPGNQNQVQSMPAQTLSGQTAMQAQMSGQIAQAETPVDPAMKPAGDPLALATSSGKTGTEGDAGKLGLATQQGNSLAGQNPNAAVAANAGMANDPAAAARQQAQQAAQQQAAARAAAANAKGAEAPMPAQTSAASTSSQGTDFSQVLQNQTQTQQAKAAAKPSQPMPAQQQTQNHALTDQVAVQINKAVKQGIDRINVQLKPADLGRIDVTLEVGHDGRVQATIQAEKPETLDILRQDAKGLEQALKDAGLDANADDLNFAMKGEGQGQSEKGSGNGDLASLASELEEEAEALAENGLAGDGPLIGADGSLDISV